MAITEYTTLFSSVLTELYAQELKSVDLYNSNTNLQIIGGKYIKIPKLSVSGYKDHTRAGSFNTGTYALDYDVKNLDHDRDVEFAIDPMDVDETNQVVSIANIQKRFESTQAIPELDSYTFSKIYTEFIAAGGTAVTTAPTTANILSLIDADLKNMEDAGVPLDRVVLYCTSTFKSMLKNADGIERSLNVNTANNLDRRVLTIDDIQKIVTVPSARFKTAFDFTNGVAAASTAKSINYILIDPEAQVSRQKYSYIKVYGPGSDSKCADNYLYQNRKYNGTFAIPELIGTGCHINMEA